MNLASDYVKCIEYRRIYGVPATWFQVLGKDKTLELCERYDYKCFECSTKTDLTIHHKDGLGWARKSRAKGMGCNNDLDNMIILCRKCHGAMEGVYGSQKRIYKLKPTLICRACGLEKKRNLFPRRVSRLTGKLTIRSRVCCSCASVFGKKVRELKGVAGKTAWDYFNNGNDGRKANVV